MILRRSNTSQQLINRSVSVLYSGRKVLQCVAVNVAHGRLGKTVPLKRTRAGRPLCNCTKTGGGFSAFELAVLVSFLNEYAGMGFVRPILWSFVLMVDDD